MASSLLSQDYFYLRALSLHDLQPFIATFCISDCSGGCAVDPTFFFFYFFFFASEEYAQNMNVNLFPYKYQVFLFFCV